ncbi:MAG: hypothetical protein JNN25_16435 [Candidatus Kapabacteria bacterium]|nr:hypothetical protein [Candidatus Kapabacteria bacterium]
MQTKQMVGGYAVERLRALWSVICFFVAAFAGAMVVDATGGGTPPDPSGTEPPANPSGTDAPPATPPSGTGSGSPAQADWRDAEIEKLRKENAARRLKEKEREEADKKAEEERLKAQGEYQKLHEQEKARAEALARENEELKQFRQAVAEKEEAVRKVELAKLPETVRPKFENASLEQIQAALELQGTVQAAQTPAPGATSPAASSNGVPPDNSKPKTLKELVQEQMNKK